MNHYFIPNPAVEFFNTIAPKPTFAGYPPRTFGTKNAPLGMSHEPAVNAPDLIAAVSSSNYR